MFLKLKYWFFEAPSKNWQPILIICFALLPIAYESKEKLFGKFGQLHPGMASSGFRDIEKFVFFKG
jgi:hypothetical protein